MKKAKLFFSTLFLLLTVSLSAQNMRVSGTITDASTGEGIPFASVVVKGTMIGTSADANGAYTLNAPSNGTLEFTAIGFVLVDEQINGRAVINIALDPDAEALDESIVIAYGTAKKSSFTGSAGTVKSESLQKRTVANVTKALEGMVAGITTTSGSGQPGEGASIRIRGTGSINASSAPLYVVDGVPFDGNLSSINPNDIESMTVLKDASAAALYGARAANGVIMLTTKRGSDGHHTVNFKATVGIQSRSIPQPDLANQQQFVELTWEALKNNYYINGGYAMEEAKALASAGMAARMGGEFYNPYKNYTWDQVIDPATGRLRADAVSAWDENWMDLLTNKQAVRQEYQLGLSGGDRNTKYGISFGYLDENGVLVTTNFKRYSLRASVDHKVNDWMQVSAGASYAYTNQNSSDYSGTQTGNVWYTAQYMAPIYPIYLKTTDGKDALDGNGQKLFDYGENGRPTASKFNPAGDLYDNVYETLRDNVSVRSSLVLGGDSDVMGIFKGLSFTTNVGADLSGRYITDYSSPFHGDGLDTDGRITKYSTRSFSYTWNQILKYERTFNALHALAQVGHEYYDYSYSLLSGERTKIYPGITELAPATTVSDNNSYKDVYRIESYFGRLAADYADKYYLEATWRADASSRFHQDHRWGQFWSLGASWRLSQEAFMQSASWIDNLTLRLSYGQLGNDGLQYTSGTANYYAWQSFYDLTYPNANLSGAVVSSLANPDISWERQGSWNAGLEGTFFHQVLSVTFDYYNKLTTDMLLNFPMATSTGFNGYDANVGTMRNQGVEATIRLNWLKTGSLRASSTLIGSMNRNKILHLTTDDTITTGSQVIRVGYPIRSFYVPKFAGVDPANGQALYWAYNKVADDKVEALKKAGSPLVTDDGKNIVWLESAGAWIEEGSERITNNKTDATNSKYFHGSREPLFQGSFGTDFQWGPVDFSFLTTFSVGGYVYDSNYSGTREIDYAGHNFSTHALRAWKQPGDITDVPVLLFNSGNLAADRWLVDASYFAIKSVQLGYTLPTKWTKKAGIQSLRLFAVADNLCMFSKLNGLNPTSSFNGATDFVYTPTRVVSLGIDINF